MELRTDSKMPTEVIYCGIQRVGERVREILGLSDCYQVFEDMYVRKDRVYIVDHEGAVQVVVIEGYGYWSLDGK